MTIANPGYHHMQIGDVLVTALNDGQFDAATALVVGVPHEACETLLRDSFRVLPPRITVSCFLLRFGGRHVLVDAGTGTAFGGVMGHAPEKLAALGVTPAQIDTVLVTHAHVDHINGLLDAEGQALYPNAELVMNPAEPAFWLNEENAARAPEERRAYFGIAQRALAPYRDRTRTVAGGAEVLPGITSHHLPGHTPGHSGYMIASGGQTLFIWGDVVHLPGIQFPRPEAGMLFDIDSDQARRTRADAFAMTAQEKLLVAGMHLDFPTFGHVVRHGSGYWFEPVIWAPTEAGPYSG